MKRFANIPVQVKAGTYDVAVTFIERARVESDEFVGFLPGDEFSRGDREPRLVGGVQVVGPFNSPGVSDTPSRRRIFICRPDRRTRKRRARAASPTNLARRAFRRPVTDEDIDSLMPYFDSGRKGTAGSTAGIEQVIAAVLVSPEFLFRAIRTPGRLKRTRRIGTSVPAERSGTGLAALVLPVESGAGRGAAQGRRGGQAARPGGAAGRRRFGC